jgi:hypothetical protein
VVDEEQIRRCENQKDGKFKVLVDRCEILGDVFNLRVVFIVPRSGWYKVGQLEKNTRLVISFVQKTIGNQVPQGCGREKK